MKKMQLLLLLLLMSSCVTAEQSMKATLKKQKNSNFVTADMKEASANWEKSPFIYYEVPAISPIKRLTNTYPTDGKFLAPLKIIAAQGEFEPASIVIYPFRTVDKLDFKASELRSGKNTIPVSAIDIKVVKIWYQQGSSWYGFYADRTQRVLTPELLLNNENLIKVDHKAKDNYVLYKFDNGTKKYTWMSFNSKNVNYKKTGQANYKLISDSPKLESSSLKPEKFKQYFITVHIPKSATAGIYNGNITLIADGKEVGKVPMIVRVLPFELPKPSTNYDVNKEFYGSIYCPDYVFDYPKMLKNLAEHNILNPMLPRASSQVSSHNFQQMIKKMKTAGLSTKPLFGAGPYVRVLADNPPTEKQRAELKRLKKLVNLTALYCQKYAGHKEIYCYGYDEGGANKIRRERSAWKIAQAAGLKTMVSSYPHGRMLFNLDFLVIPGMPVEERKKAVDMQHLSNPNSLVAWYANPHSGPENPEYFRRLHGMMTYKSNYDAICNYIWFRNNWNDFWVPDEAIMRGLMMVYPTKDDVIDTLAWEGIREGIDDIRYATKLRILALQALKSKSVKVNYAGRKALSWLAHLDEKRADLNATRLEMINYILNLRQVLKGDK